MPENEDLGQLQILRRTEGIFISASAVSYCVAYKTQTARTFERKLQPRGPELRLAGPPSKSR